MRGRKEVRLEVKYEGRYLEMIRNVLLKDVSKIDVVCTVVINHTVAIISFVGFDTDLI